MKFSEIIGRDTYKSMINNALNYHKASLVAMYGRRRVGKTFLLKNHLHNQISFQYSGIHNVTSNVQLSKFSKAISDQLNGGKPLAKQADWFEAFDVLITQLNKKRSKRIVIFLDEFPWMHELNRIF